MVKYLLKILAEGLYWGLVASVGIAVVFTLFVLLHLFVWMVI